MKQIFGQLRQDARYAVRTLSRRPGFTTVAALSLGIGIGANAAIFGVADALMFRALPVDRPDQLVRFQYPGEDFGFSYPSFEIYRQRATVFSDIAAICVVDRTAGDQRGVGDAQPVRIALVSDRYFSMLGVGAAAGRALASGDDRGAAGQPVAVISNRYWSQHYGGSPETLGSRLVVNATAYTIVGVMPRGFSGDWIGRPVDAWIPIAMQAQVMPERPLLTNPGPPWLRIMARLAPGVELGQAQAAVRAIYPRTIDPLHLAARQRDLALRTLPTLVPAATGFSPERDRVARPLAFVAAVVALILLIACTNVANLLLMRSTTRARELSVRRALGATRTRIARQLLTETGVLTVVGTVVGVLIAAWGAGGFAAIARSTLATDLDVRFDWRVFAYTAAVSVVAALLFGVGPALRSARSPIDTTLKGRTIGSAGGLWVGKMLVVVQIAAAFVLLVSALLLVRSLAALQSQNLGYDRQHVLLVWTAPEQAGRRGDSLAPLFERAEAGIEALPGVVSASASTHGILSRFFGNGPVLRVEAGQPIAGPETSAPWNVVGSRFFRTTGMRLLAGRDFTDRDTERSPHVAIVNETLAHDLFGDRDPLGRHFGKGREDGYPWEIVGVVADAKDNAPRDNHRPMFYVPYRQDVEHLDGLCVAVRTTRNGAGVIGSIRQTLHDLDPRMPILRVETVQQQLDGTLGQERLSADVSTVFGLVAVVLCCLGLYGIVAYLTERRTNEIGIRVALGAAQSTILRMIVGESFVLGLAGISCGVPLAVIATRLLASQLFAVSTTGSVSTIAAAGALMMSIAAVAGLTPARRAARIDPVTSLRRGAE